MRRLLLTLCFAVLLPLLAVPTPGSAQAPSLDELREQDEPLEINAKEGIEWRREEQLYIARGSAVVSSGDLAVHAEVLSAHYVELPDGSSEIDRVDAEGDVRIVTPNGVVYGDAGAFDVVNGVLVLVGDNLRLESGDDLVTARDSLEYWEGKRLAVARGDAQAVRDDRRVQADILSAHFEPDANGDLQIRRIDAIGNVRIVTPTEFAQGDRGVYYVDERVATLKGDVKITRGENQLNGEYAEVNLGSGVSRLLASAPGENTSTGGNTSRVQSLILPRKKPVAGSGQ